MKLLRTSQLLLLLMLCVSIQAVDRAKLNFNSEWKLCIGDVAGAENTDYEDSRWQQVTLPYAFNGGEAFRKDIVDLTDTIVWYRKTFEVNSKELKNEKYFIEFEGVRQGADFYLNGHHLGYSENGVIQSAFWGKYNNSVEKLDYVDNKL